MGLFFHLREEIVNTVRSGNVSLQGDESKVVIYTYLRTSYKVVKFIPLIQCPPGFNPTWFTGRKK